MADFGLLRHEHATNIDHTSGTLRYKGPECFDGRPTDCRRDVYALGLLFYEMLTGEAVVTKLEDAAAMVLRIFNDIPSPPSAKNPRIAPEIPWNNIAGMRDKLAHKYWLMDIDIVWAVVEKELPRLLVAAKGVLKGS